MMSLTTGHIWGHFSNTDAMFSQTPGETADAAEQEERKVGKGGVRTG